MKKIIITIGSMGMTLMPVATVISCNESPKSHKEITILGDKADFVEKGTKGKKPDITIEVNFIGVKTSKDLDKKMQKAFKNVDPKKSIGKILFIKITKPNKEVWSAKAIIKNEKEMEKSPMGNIYREIAKSLNLNNAIYFFKK